SEKINIDEFTIIADYIIDIVSKLKSIQKWKEGNQHCSTNAVKIHNSFKAFYNEQQKSLITLNDTIKKFSRGASPLIKKNDRRIKTKLVGYLILYFDKKIGPSVFYKQPADLDPETLENVKRIMDILNKEPFFYNFNNKITFNYQFEIDSPNARGGKEYLQISLIFSIIDDLDVDFFKVFLKDTSKKIKKIKDLYKLFYVKSKSLDKIPDNESQLKRMKNLLLENFRILKNYL
ncbi:MAG: hypothetical protein ACTSRA_19260, partial [Promethearchaeota archaeon]